MTSEVGPRGLSLVEGALRIVGLACVSGEVFLFFPPFVLLDSSRETLRFLLLMLMLAPLLAESDEIEGVAFYRLALASIKQLET